MKRQQELAGLLLDLGLAIQASAIYPESHQKVQALLTRLHGKLQEETRRSQVLHIGFLGDHAVIDEFPFIGLNPNLGRLIGKMRDRGIEKISFRDGITFGELKRFVYFVGGGQKGEADHRWEFIDYGKIQGIAESEDSASVLSSRASSSHVLLGATEVLKDLLLSMAGERSGKNVSDGRDIVAAVMKGLRMEGMLIDSLIRLQAHDDYTVTHSLNVCVIVVAQAMHAGFSERSVQEIGLAALFHDIGKEVIPAEILNKPGKLAPEEFVQIAVHPVTGAKLLRRIDCGSDLPMIVAFEHHIKYDRSGYPEAMFQSPLHPASHMTQIADVYDALRTFRPYRKSLDRETAVSIMREGRGNEFEPTMFDAFLELLT